MHMNHYRNRIKLLEVKGNCDDLVMGAAIFTLTFYL